ncbi:NucA/NucB deoxyribonuclease domain-containing protein [Actinomadura yumaensis]|uniref:NucA/NucB deoxyribonuclease domain-containing protein n=1 Tax=Actinomadura yumaensis TaxID=111807 RepID=A0ABW2CQN8_9ACTN
MAALAALLASASLVLPSQANAGSSASGREANGTTAVPSPMRGPKDHSVVKALPPVKMIKCGDALNRLRASKGTAKHVACLDEHPLARTFGIGPDPNWDAHPDFCQFNKAVLYSRQDACQWGTWPFRVLDRQGTLVGSGVIEYLVWETVNTKSLDMYQVLKVRPLALTGVAEVNTFTPTTTCSGAQCAITGTDPVTPTIPVVTGRAYKGTWNAKVSVAKDKSFLTHWTNHLQITGPGWIQPASADLPDAPAIRCDKIITKSTGGCVLPGWPPTLSLSLSDTDPENGVSEAAQHIKDSQNRGPHWGREKDGKPLTRLIDTKLQKANRDAACPASRPPGPAGTSCDEYPFASTHQGAALEGKNDFTVRDINEHHNSNAGTDLGLVYNTYRMLDGDQFWVRIDP